jgi:hypothetical protein
MRVAQADGEVAHLVHHLQHPPVFAGRAQRHPQPKPQIDRLGQCLRRLGQMGRRGDRLLEEADG